MSEVLQIRNLLVRRSGSVVLELDSLDLHMGEVLALVGPNGAGKSTLLLAMAQLLKYQKGEITFRGFPLSQLDPLDFRRRISLVFQNPLLLDMSVEDNVALGLRFRGLPKAEVDERVRRWLRQLDIDDLRRRRAVELSGGEAQRVSLARAFAPEPELLFLDEPFPGLDPPARASLLEDLAYLLQDGRRTAVLVTHNLREAAQLSDRIAVIAGGRLRQVGTANSIKRRPADAEVADFLRTMPR